MSDDASKASDRTTKSRKKKKKGTRRAKASAAVPTPPPAASKPSRTNAAITLVVVLLCGLVGGWFLRDIKGTAEALEASPDPAPSTASSAEGGLCADWAQKVCTGVGEKDEACSQAKAAADLLPPGACVKALDAVPATVAKAKSARSICDQLVDKACKDLGKDTETCKMVTERTAEFPASQCKSMLDNYAKVIGELKQMEKANAPLSAEEAKKISSGDVPTFGPADAKVTVVEFSDFECPYCAMAAETMNSLKERYGENVRFVFRQFPLSFHKKAQLAAEASMAALAQGKFWEFHDKVFENQREMEREDLEKHAKAVGLDMAKFTKALDDHTYEKTVKADLKLGEEVGVSGTPSFFVGNKRVADPSVAGISSEIDAQLAAN